MVHPHPLAHVQFKRRCNACGGAYAVTLYDVLQEKRIQREWRSPRPPRGCHANFDSLVSEIPAELLDDVDRAWQRLIAHLPPEIDLQSV